MTVSDRQAVYLDAMGISLWRRRDRPVDNAPAHHDPAPAPWQLPRGALSRWLSKRVVAKRQFIQSASSQLVIVSDWQATDENSQGVFYGDSGVLLDNMLKAINLSRQQVGLVGLAGPASVGQENLEAVLAEVPIKVILFMSALPGDCPVEDFAAYGIAGQTCLGVPLIPSFHPAYLLLNTPAKRLAWQDLKQARSLLGY